MKARNQTRADVKTAMKAAVDALKRITEELEAEEAEKGELRGGYRWKGGSKTKAFSPFRLNYRPSHAAADVINKMDELGMRWQGLIDRFIVETYGEDVRHVFSREGEKKINVEFKRTYRRAA